MDFFSFIEPPGEVAATWDVLKQVASEFAAQNQDMLTFKEEIKALQKKFEVSEVEHASTRAELTSTRAELVSIRKELESKTEELNDRINSLAQSDAKRTAAVMLICQGLGVLASK